MSKKISSLFDAKKIPQDAVKIIENFDQIVQGVRPLNSRQLQQLPQDIRALSHQMTDERSSRRLGYMNENAQLSSYVRYFTWWNLVRLTRLFSNLPDSLFSFNDRDDTVCLDLGSGPLTVVTALFLSVCARLNAQPWKIIRVKGSFGTAIKEKASLITCANMFNELDQASDMPPEFKVKKYYDQLLHYAGKDARYILVEPGVPKAARTLSLLRERFIKGGSSITAPCPHSGDCPMSGFGAYTGSKNKWCNFAFETADAPRNLQKLSDQAKLPKERATLSFIAVDSQFKEENDQKLSDQGQLIRISSDEFRLPNYMSGFYACTEYGLALVELPSQNNTRLLKPPFRPVSGDLIEVKKIKPDSLPKDEKSGSIVIKI